MAWPDIIMDPVRGKSSLSTAFWGYGFGASVLFSIPPLFVDLEQANAIKIYLGLGLLLGIYQLVCLWQCAPNCKSPLLKTYTRVCVVASFLALPFILYVASTVDLANVLNSLVDGTREQ